MIYVRDMAALTGLIISTAPAVGRSARFYNRASVGWWQELVNLCGWGTKDEKRFQCPLLDWEVVKVVPTGSSGPWRWGSIY